MSISRSIYGLAKNNNGFFKSDKQRDFLISQLDFYEGYVTSADSGYNSCPVFAEYDNKGITKIIKSSKGGDILMFERKEEGVLNSLEVKEIKRLEKLLKSLKREISERQDIFDSGNYNGSGDISSYNSSMFERFKDHQKQKVERVLKLEIKIKEIKG